MDLFQNQKLQNDTHQYDLYKPERPIPTECHIGDEFIYLFLN